MRADAVGAGAEVEVEVSARWMMAYSAAAGVADARWFDSAGVVPAHPVFSVAPEWVLMTMGHDPFGLDLSPAEVLRGIHASHDIEVHRPISAGDVLTVRGTVVGLRQIRSGALATIRFISTDQQERPVITTYKDMVYLGVRLDGDDVRPPTRTPEPALTPVSQMLTATRTLDIGAAHVYTECARIWNPIHTDVVAARRAGLRGTIFHGTATLATGVTCVLECLDADPAAVRKVAGRFSNMVSLPAVFDVSMAVGASPEGGRVCHFDVRADGRAVLERGLVVLA